MRVKFNGTEYDTTSRGMLASIKFERHYGVAYSDAFVEGKLPRMEHMAFLAYTELQADGVAVGEFDDTFFAGLEFVAPVEDAVAGQEQLPLDQAAQPTS